MDASAYDAWYETPRGRWIASRELGLVRNMLAPCSGESLLDVGCLARRAEEFWPAWLHGGAFLLVAADLAR